MKRRTAVLLVCGLLAGCMSAGYERSVLREPLAGEPSKVNEEDIRRAFERRRPIQLPMKLGVWLVPDWPGMPTPLWRKETKAALVDSLKGLKEDGIVADAFFVSSMVTSGGDLNAIRLAAALEGANAVLIVRAATVTDNYMTPAGVANLTIVGGFLLPGSRAEALSVVRGALWEVASGSLHATAEADARASTIGPTFVLREAPAIEQATDQAVAAFSKAIVARMKALPASTMPSTAGAGRDTPQ